MKKIRILDKHYIHESIFRDIYYKHQENYSFVIRKLIRRGSFHATNMGSNLLLKKEL